MRRRFKPTWMERRAVRENIIRLVQAGRVLEILRRAGIPEDFRPTDADFRLESLHPDRFVLRVTLRSNGHAVRAYALKAYADGFGEQVWEHCQKLAAQETCPHGSLCLPLHYLSDERILVFPWVEGPFLSEISDGRKPVLLRDAARLAAHLHRLPVVPEEETTLQMLLDEVADRCARLRANWPGAYPLVEPFPELLREAATRLVPATPALVHGDLASGQFLCSDNRLFLLDLDMFGYTDPAYDVGHFLAQQERRCLLDPTVRGYADEWLAAFSDAYLAAMPDVSWRNVSFYRALTFVRKVYTLCRRDPESAPGEGPVLADRAQRYLHEVITAG
jgi:phosphotransferase family enzyme